jgi:hypothetical protein
LLFVNNAVPYLAILNLCCLPYTFWSLWYQYKAKNWCVLCCTVQALLWLQFIVFATGTGYAVPALEVTTIVAMLFSFAIPVVIWAFVKPFMLKAEQLAPLKQQLKKFKYNSDLFNQVLTNQPRFSVPNDIMLLYWAILKQKTSSPWSAIRSVDHVPVRTAPWING